MSESLITTLVGNVALLLSLVYLLDYFLKHVSTKVPVVKQFFIGLLLSAICITLMLTHWKHSPGIIFDTRSILLGISGLFFGVIPTVIAIISAAVFRLLQGGGGIVTGTGVIISSGLFGLLWRFYLSKKHSELSWLKLYLFGISLHIVMLIWMFALPQDSVVNVLKTISIPVIIIYPFGTVLLGLLLNDRVHREMERLQIIESRQRLQLALQSGNIGLWEFDLVTGEVYFSPEWKAQIGYMDYEIKNENSEWEERLHPDDVNSTLKELEAFKRGISEEYSVKFRLQHKDGDYRWIYAKGKLYFAKDGKPKKILGTHIDITDQRLVENELKMSEHRFRKSLENIPDVVVRYDKDLRIRFINEATRKITGQNIEFFIGKRDDEIWPPEVYTAYLPSLEKAFETGEVLSIETELKIPKTGSRFLQITCVPLVDDNGNIDEVMGITHDFSDRKYTELALLESEALYRNLMEAAPITIAVHSEGKLLFLNKFGMDLLGADSLDQVIGMEIAKIIHPTKLEQAEERIRRLLSGEKGLYPVEDKYLKLDGTPIDVEVMATALKYDGKPAVQVIVSDITERNRIQKELEKHRKHLESLVEERTVDLKNVNKELEAFAYSVSHDLRAPLRAIDGYTKIIEEEYENLFDDEGKRLLGVICNESDRMGQLIDDLLEFSRIGRKDINSSRIDMKTMANSIYYELTTSDQRKKIDFILEDIPEGYGDPSLMRQVWINLISNAIKFSSKRDKALINISSDFHDNKTVYSVSDNGVGFNMQYIGKLFGVFQRLHSMKEFPGTGVGLANVKRIINRHMGEVWAESKEGIGSSFYFTLTSRGE